LLHPSDTPRSHPVSRPNPLIILAQWSDGLIKPFNSSGESGLNRELLFRENYSDPERIDARYGFGFSLATEGAGRGLSTAADNFLALAPDAISIFESSTGADKQKKTRDEHYAQSRANVTITNTSSSGGGGSGSTYNYTYSKPFGSPGGNWSPQGIIGPYNFSTAQQGALQNFVSVVNAVSFDARAFVSALQGVVSAFSVK
jgi:hypothetical protein